MMTNRPHQIVVAYSVGAGGAAVLERAVDYAAAEPNRVLHIVHALDPHAGTQLVPMTGACDYSYADAVQTELIRIVGGVLVARKPPHEVHFFCHARIGKAADEILSVAREVGAELILVGSHDKTTLERVLLGSTSAAVVRAASCSVFVVRAAQYRAVDLLDVRPDDHPHHTYKPPHRYVYENQRVIKRPTDWPLL
jgi:nucleotide-binding universal stress UspA family protein